MFHASKTAAARALFRALGVRQIHIIGCSRSGTTMLHAAMSAFEGVQLHPAETRAEQPTFSERVRAARRFRAADGGGPRVFVTKRAYAWIEPAQIQALVARARAERLGLIHIVRDPRDTLLSRHVSSARERYVTPAHWRASIAAAEQVEAATKGRCSFLTIRYEDVVEQPRAVEEALARTFGLRLRPGAELDRVADSLASSGAALSPYMAQNMQGVRNADRASIGKWRGSADDPEADLLADPDAAPLYRAFVRRHGYAV